MATSSSNPEGDERPRICPGADAEMDVLIDVHRELAKDADLRRQRIDAAGANLVTTCIALGAGVIAGADAIDDAGRTAEALSPITLVVLTIALAVAALSRVGHLEKVRAEPSTPWSRRG